ncbi:RdgB/HAM1 family non-canonical purine NTP pyrophosphatase [Pedobacter frigiditerrae]|uniref:dITP/XTP pyrophosphatase n=1 Tax=Pedobacter frigiditerrae TaxID=2530452 RepID=A0A4R0N3G4_9SPHI|nr:RdgB/HAM1 family non-canonical purine NTP pyrophosphatase [Pedobacter frigiditerrae]TCC94389.1 RdgB/HAM1 family non-canonical purine NTP pyrophosphatase [Pedobacter frigiditerrae]
MANRLVFATNNQHKTSEVRELLKPNYQVLNLTDIGCEYDIPETGDTFAENAALKSIYVVENFHIDCFADDSGLEVEALNNEPGIYSARYSGKRGDAENLKFLLQKMDGVENRNARFKTVISLIKNGESYFFEGVIAGKLRTEPSGEKGFGYDPIFEPNGYNITFAEMEMAEKNQISHRALAMRKLIAFLQQGT